MCSSFSFLHHRLQNTYFHTHSGGVLGELSQTKQKQKTLHFLFGNQKTLHLFAGTKNTVPGDKSALVPGGIRVGTPAMTSRGFDEKDFEQVASFIDRGVKIAHEVHAKAGGLCLFYCPVIL